MAWFTLREAVKRGRSRDSLKRAITMEEIASYRTASGQTMIWIEERSPLWVALDDVRKRLGDVQRELAAIREATSGGFVSASEVSGLNLVDEAPAWAPAAPAVQPWDRAAGEGSRQVRRFRKTQVAAVAERPGTRRQAPPLPIRQHEAPAAKAA